MPPTDYNEHQLQQQVWEVAEEAAAEPLGEECSGEEVAEGAAFHLPLAGGLVVHLLQVCWV